MNVLGNTPPPATGIDATTSDGFAFSNNTRVSGAGVLLLGGEVYKWRPWGSLTEEGGKGKEGEGEVVGEGDKRLEGQLRNAKGQWEPALDKEPWGLLEVLHPKPDLLIIGTGKGIVPISPATRRRINELGVRIEVQDTRNAASQYNLLATERGVGQVGAALVPIGFREVTS